MDSSIAIEIDQLGKVYGAVKAVEDLSLRIFSGEIFGLLGPNGAGKSTTLKILITILRPSTGKAMICGHDVVEKAETVRALIGYVPQERAIDRFLTGREHLLLLGDLYHLPKDQAQKRIEELLKLVDLETQADRPAKTYSGGMKRKLDIACGLLPDPKILFLDEPTLGLDVQSRLRIWEYIRNLKAKGMTIVMTTNYLEEADQLCDRLAIIDGGHIRVIGSPKDLKAQLGGDSVSLTISPDKLANLPQLASELKSLAYIREIQTTSSGLVIRVDSPEKSLSAVLELAGRMDCPVENFEYHRPRLDDVFLTHTGHAMKGEFPEVEPE